MDQDRFGYGTDIPSNPLMDESIDRFATYMSDVGLEGPRGHEKMYAILEEMVKLHGSPEEAIKRMNPNIRDIVTKDDKMMSVLFGDDRWELMRGNK